MTDLKNKFDAFVARMQTKESKEAALSLFKATPEELARTLYETWKAHIQADLLPDFRLLLQAMHNWNAQVFNYFDHRITSAYTESINNLIKGMNRMARGYSFEVLRARLLYNEEARKATTVRTSARKKSQSPGMKDFTMYS